MPPKLFTSEELPDKAVVRSGVETLDSVIKGLPHPGVTEIFGPPGAGKSLLSLLFKPSIYVDVEGAMQGSWLSLWSPSTYVCRINKWEDLSDFLDEVCYKPQYPVVVVDSIAAVSFDDERPGALSRHLGGWVVKNAPVISCSLVLLNHARLEWGPYPSISSPGGFGIKHASDLRLKVRKGDLKSTTWHEAIVEVVKSKIGPSSGRCSVFFNLTTGEVSTKRPVKGGELDVPVS